MKRFKWPLQRLLDVTVLREQALRNELLGLFREMARTRQQIFRRQAVLRVALDDLAAKQLARRIAQQEVFMSCADRCEQEIRQLTRRLGALGSQRREKMEQFMRTRASVETLQRKREEARRLHMSEQIKVEQGRLDESAHIAFAGRARGKQAQQSGLGV